MAHSPDSFPLLLACREVVGPFTPATHKRAVSPSAISRELVVYCVVVVGHHRHARRPLSHSVGLHTAGRRRQRGKQRHTSRRVASRRVSLRRSLGRAQWQRIAESSLSPMLFPKRCYFANDTILVRARHSLYVHSGKPDYGCGRMRACSSNVYYSDDIRVCVRLHMNVVTRIDGMK